MKYSVDYSDLVLICFGKYYHISKASMKVTFLPNIIYLNQWTKANLNNIKSCSPNLFACISRNIMFANFIPSQILNWQLKYFITLLNSWKGVISIFWNKSIVFKMHPKTALNYILTVCYILLPNNLLIMVHFYARKISL